MAIKSLLGITYLLTTATIFYSYFLLSFGSLTKLIEISFVSVPSSFAAA